MRNRRWARFVVAALGAAATVLAPAGAAYADSSVSVPLTRLGAMAVDAVHGRVFLTGGGNQSSLLVRNLAGGAVGTVPGLPGATGLALGADAATLYVALAGGDAIATVDTTTLTETGRYPTGAGTCPARLGLAGGKLYFGYGCANGSGRLGSVDISGAGTVQLNLAGFYYAPLIATTPGNTDVLAAADPGMSPGTVRLFDLSGGNPVQVASRSDTCTNLQDLAITPDATRVLLACGHPYHHQAFSTPDLSSAGVYTSGAYPVAVASASDSGSVIAGSDSPSGPDVFVARVNGSALRSYEFPPDESVATGGIAAGADGTAYVVTTTSSGAVRLHVLPGATLSPASLTVTAPTATTRNTPLTVTGTLSFADAPVSEPRQLQVTRQDLTGSHVLPAVTTSADGTFSFQDKPPTGGTNTYTVGYAGDATHSAASKRVTVAVSRRATSITITTNATTYAYGATATVTVKLGATHDSRAVCLYALPSGGTRTTVRCGAVNSAGALTATYRMTRRTVLTAAFAGDQWYAPAAVPRTVSAAPRVTQVLTGHHGTSGAYRLYRRGVNPVFTVTLAPNRAGACVGFVAQVYSSGAWRNVASAKCFRLDAESRASGELVGGHTVGPAYRMRATFGGDAVNAATNGPWMKLKFTR